VTRLVHVTTVPISLRFITGQAQFMAQRGLKVAAVSSPEPGLVRFGEQEGVDVHGIGMAREISPLRDAVALARMVRLFRRLRPTIVHGHTPKGGLLSMCAAWLTRTPVRVYHLHGLRYVTATGYQRELLRWTERLSCRLAHRVLCVSPSVRQVAMNDRICKPEKIAVPLGGTINGIDARGRFNPERFGAKERLAVRQRYAIPPDALVVGFVGRIARDKGITELLAAKRTLSEEFSNLHWLIVGTFDDTDPIKPEERDEILGDSRIHLTGWIEDIVELYAAMDVLVLPTYREGFPTAPIEAAAMEVPVVATRIPGCVDAVQDGVTGTLVPPRDPESLAAAIRAYLKAPELRRRHGQAGRERVLREFRQEAIWEALFQEYVRLLQEKGLPPPKPDQIVEFESVGAHEPATAGVAGSN